MRVSETLRTSLLSAILAIAFIVINQANAEASEAIDVAEKVSELIQMGDYLGAVRLAKQALDAAESKTRQSDYVLAEPLHNLAILYSLTGEFPKAETLYKREITILEREQGLKSIQRAVALKNLGGLYGLVGQYAKGEKLLKESLRIGEDLLGYSDPLVADTLDDLGSVYFYMGDLESAEAAYQRAKEILEKQPESISLARTLINLAGIYAEKKDFDTAEKYALKSLGISTRIFGPDHPQTALTLHNLGIIYYAQGKYAQADNFVHRAITSEEQNGNTNLLGLASFQTSLSRIKVARKDYTSAIAALKKSIALQEKAIGNYLVSTSDTEKLRFIQAMSSTYTTFLALIPQHLKDFPDAVRDGFEVVLARKGIAYEIAARPWEAQTSDATKWNRLITLRSDRARLSLNRPQQMGLQLYEDTLRSLDQEIEDTEKRLAEENAFMAAERIRRRITIRDVVKQLPEGSAYVDFVKTPDFSFVDGRSGKSSRYLGFILKANGTLTLVDLKDSTRIDDQIRVTLDHINGSMRLFNKGVTVEQLKRKGESSLKLFNNLYLTVWQPLESSIQNVNKVFVSPDGLLSLIPFSALVDSNGKFLLDRYIISYVSSGREMVGSGRAPPKTDLDLLLVANPAYDQELRALNTGETHRSLDQLRLFLPLPGIEQEAIEIPALLPANSKKRILVGPLATEAAVKTAISPRILHLATHGFFLPDKDLKADSYGRPLIALENPLVRSGLALAGANNAADVMEGDDGILTALEVIGMDLHDTELVVLSACETGYGHVENGEGVFGLRRAFSLAGAENLLMTLWPVADGIALKQMKEFYISFQTDSKAAEALTQAQRNTVQELSKEFGMAPPELWAPFILQISKGGL